MLKYGMVYSTIKYYQNEAKSLWFHNGIKYHGFLTSDCPINQIESRRIGHDAIAAAAVRTPEEMRKLLSGK